MQDGQAIDVGEACEPCPECGIGDAEYGLHERGCPSGYPTQDPELDNLQNTYRETEDEATGT